MYEIAKWEQTLENEFWIEGFYEWQKTPRGKTPHYIHMRDGSPMPLAGIWERWRSPSGEELESCAILTTAANSVISPVHDRMPVILCTADLPAWLDHSSTLETLQPLLTPLFSDGIVTSTVSTLVNNPAYDQPECLKRAEL